MQHFVMELTYKAPLDDIKQHMQAHVDHLKNGAAKGQVLAFGGKPTGGGGIMILRFASQNDAQSFVDADPFVQKNLVETKCTEFNSSFWQQIP